MRFKLIVLLFIQCTVLKAHHPSGNIYTNTLLTGREGIIAKGKFSFLLITQANNFKLLSNTNAQSFNVNSMYVNNASLIYGVSKILNITASLPYLYVQGLSPISSIASEEKQYNGLGDASIYASIAVLKHKKINLIANVGVELPTGKTQNEYVNTITSTSNFGSNTFDGLFGLSIIKSFKTIKLIGQYQKTVTQKNSDNYHFGNNDQLSIKVTKSFAPKTCTEYSCTSNGSCLCSKKKESFFTINTGLIFEKNQQQQWNSENIENTGNCILFTSIGANIYINKNINIPIRSDLPLYQKINGVQNKISNRFTTGINFNF